MAAGATGDGYPPGAGDGDTGGAGGAGRGGGGPGVGPRVDGGGYADARRGGGVTEGAGPDAGPVVGGGVRAGGVDPDDGDGPTGGRGGGTDAEPGAGARGGGVGSPGPRVGDRRNRDDASDDPDRSPGGKVPRGRLAARTDDTRSRASLRAAAVGWRSAGSLAMDRSTTAASWRGTSSGNGGGGSLTIRNMIAAGVSSLPAAKAFRPASSE